MLTVLKCGGAILEDKQKRTALLEAFAAMEGPKMLVHGGGRDANKMAARLGLETKMVGGRRITDAAMLGVVTMVYGGLVNKGLVAELQSMGQKALGMTGADLGIVLSDKRPVLDGIDYGFVGDVRKVDAEALAGLLAMGVVPVLAPLTCDGKGGLLNTNADTIASSVASAMSCCHETSLVFCFEKEGVLDREGKPISRITRESYEALKKDGTVTDGMIPKLDNAFAAIAAGVSDVRITKWDSPAYGGTAIC